MTNLECACCNEKLHYRQLRCGLVCYGHCEGAPPVSMLLGGVGHLLQRRCTLSKNSTLLYNEPYKPLASFTKLDL